jgi:putative transposase
MPRDTTVAFRQPEAIDDPLSEVAREGARRMLAQVLIAEADSFVALWKDWKLPDGRDRVVRHGHGPDRAIQTGVGPVEVRRAKVRDRGDVGAAEKIRFTSSILSKRARRLPVLYLRGVSTGDFQEVLTALLEAQLGRRNHFSRRPRDCICIEQFRPKVDDHHRCRSVHHFH